MDNFEWQWWLFAARKLLLFGASIVVVLLLPILFIQNVRQKAREKERLQMKILEELEKLNGK